MPGHAGSEAGVARQSIAPWFSSLSAHLLPGFHKPAMPLSAAAWRGLILGLPGRSKSVKRNRGLFYSALRGQHASQVAESASGIARPTTLGISQRKLPSYSIHR